MNNAARAMEFPPLQQPIIWRAAVSAQDHMRMRLLLRACNVFSEAQIEAGCEMLQSRLDNPHSPTQFLFALQHYELVGNACYGPIPFTKNRFELHWVAVNPERQQHGIAEEIVRRAEATVRALGGVKLYANPPTCAEFEPARRLFEAAGFVAEAEQKDYYSDGNHRLIFVKSL